MRTPLFLLLAICSVIINQVFSIPLTVVPGKSGEQQVKEALDKAERESEQAAKEAATGPKPTPKEEKGKNEKNSSESSTTDKKDSQAVEKNEKKVVTSADDASKKEDTKAASPSNESSEKVDLGRKVDETSKVEVKEDHKDGSAPSSNISSSSANEGTTSNNSSSSSISINSNSKSDNTTMLNKKLTSALIKEESGKDVDIDKENEKLEEESNRKMTEMAKKLNSLVMRFQHKLAEGVESRISRMKLLQVLQKLDRLRSRAHGDNDDNRRRGKTANSNPLDLSSLAKLKGGRELAFLSKNRTHMPNSCLRCIIMKNGQQKANGQITNQYKEDTKLEDRLAMEAEEERKFNNGETYESDEDLAGESKPPPSQFAGSSLSPKEQASQEMQSYNALISSESNRELSQIQEEIAKTSQTGMGQVSVEGENQNAPMEGGNGQAGGGLAGQLGSTIAAQLGAQLNGGNLASQLTGSVENSLSNMATGGQTMESNGQGSLESTPNVESLETGGATGSDVSQAISSMSEMGAGGAQEGSQFQPGITSISPSQGGAVSPEGGMTGGIAGGMTGGIEQAGLSEAMQGLSTGGSIEALSQQAGAGAINAGSIEGLSGQSNAGIPGAMPGSVIEGAKFAGDDDGFENMFPMQQGVYNKKSQILKKTRKGKKQNVVGKQRSPARLPQKSQEEQKKTSRHVKRSKKMKVTA